MMTLVLSGVPGVGFFGRQQQPDGTSRAGRLNPGSTGGAGKSRAIGPRHRRDTCTSTLMALFHSRQKYYREVRIVVCCGYSLSAGAYKSRVMHGLAPELPGTSIDGFAASAQRRRRGSDFRVHLFCGVWSFFNWGQMPSPPVRVLPAFFSSLLFSFFFLQLSIDAWLP